MTLTLTDMLSRVDQCGGIPTSPHTPVEGECWLMDIWHNSAGYPYVHFEGRDQPAHRVIYVLTTGLDIDGLELDHLCRRPACVNPAHEEPVTHAENQRRIRKHQTSCRRAGHDWTDPNNVRVRPDGSRFCAVCDREAQRDRYVPTGSPQNGTQTTCKQGHPLVGDNLIIQNHPDGRFRQRRCRTCTNDRRRADR